MCVKTASSPVSGFTTVTTVLGLIPLAVGWGEGSEVRAPMAITVMGGLLFSTLLTMIFIPVAYELVDRKGFVPADAQEGESDAVPGAAGAADLDFESA